LSRNIEQLHTALSEKYPFLSIIVYGEKEDEEIVGIIQHYDQTITCVYDFGLLTSKEEQKEFLELGERWWFESNKLLPINIFLHEEFSKFNRIFKILATRNTNLICGPATSLNLLIQKKKRRSTIVVKRL
jgi:hypothetical protein